MRHHNRTATGRERYHELKTSDQSRIGYAHAYLR